MNSQHRSTARRFFSGTALSFNYLGQIRNLILLIRNCFVRPHSVRPVLPPLSHRHFQQRRALSLTHPLILSLVFYLAGCTPEQPDSYTNWEVYGGSKANIRYSSLRQIDTTNVGRLKVLWTYHTGDSDSSRTQIQVNPIIADGVLFGVSPKLKLFALDAATGAEKWVFDPLTDSPADTRGGYFSMNICRGVTLYRDSTGEKRIFYGAGPYLYCINAQTGKMIPGFGLEGRIDLHDGLGRDVSELFVANTTPGVVYKDMIIIGMRVDESAAAAPGHVRAYDVHTGELRWIFHTIPQKGEFGYESWDDPEAYLHVGGANSWSGLSLDEEKGILFVPTGSASFDFYGGKRLGDNLFANCLIALNANTGERIWHFQTVHHDVWDRDLPTAPALVTVKKDGRTIEAVAQPTKSGFVFLFDRTTGDPVYPIDERPVPTNTELDGEVLKPTQPYPVLPEPFARQSVTEADLNDLVPDSSYQELKARFAGYKTGNVFTPPSREGTIIFPGFDGGAEWGGPAFDPETGLLYVNANEMPWILTMVEVKDDEPAEETNLTAGQRLYARHCRSCHGPDRKGAGNVPSIAEANTKYDGAAFTTLVRSGVRMMPAFPQLDDKELAAIAAFVLDDKAAQTKKFEGPKEPSNPYWKMPYGTTGYNKFLTKEGYPGIKPPWGTLSAVNLNTGKIEWKTTLGSYPEFEAKGIRTGSENYGGPVVTAGGLVFIAATRDAKFRAFNKHTGQLLFETDLPAAGFATPAVYELNGKQYIVIACGGGKLGVRSGDAFVALGI
ncbi:MAG: PQQ-binding-like beta-propeller repeat protein [Lewinellaceae bacterium]|nr:PQQ-binding-like beta-propeller repeat protein [Lewinellaceae bacterium]